MGITTASTESSEHLPVIPIDNQLSATNGESTDSDNSRNKLEERGNPSVVIMMPENKETGDGGEPIAIPPTRLTGVRLYSLGFALAIANLMMAMDATILGPAIPQITSDFHTLEHIGWYSSAYLLAQLSCQPLFGRFYLYFEHKLWYCMSLLLFEAGSVLCATAPNSPAFILGRAISGCGAAGILTGSLAIFGDSAPMRERPRGLALVASFQSIAYMSGPVLSGVLTSSRLTWRFCFWINIPIGVISVVVIFFVIDRRPSRYRHLPLHQKLLRLDPVGAMLLISSMICLFIALEWGGTVLPWSAPKVWGCLIGFGLLAIVFVCHQSLMGNKAVIPLRILKQRTVAVCCVFSCLYGASMVVYPLLLPTYFQTVHGVSSGLSGVYYLPMTIMSIVCIVITGFTITAYGYYAPFLWIGSLLFMAGTVLLHKLDAQSNAAQYLGYQIVPGAGFGLTIHVSLIAVQVVSKPEDMPTACVMEIFFHLVGGAVGASIGQNLFLGSLTSRIHEIMAPEEARTFVQGGLANMVKVMKTLTVEAQGQVKDALSYAIATAFILPIAATSLAIVVSMGVERRKIEAEEESEPARESTSIGV